MQCPDCGHVLSEDNYICDNCGYNIQQNLDQDGSKKYEPKNNVSDEDLKKFKESL